MPFKTTPRSAFGESTLRRKLNIFQKPFTRRGPVGRSALERRPFVDAVESQGAIVVKTGPEGNLLLEARLPGLKADDIDLDVTDDILTLRGDRRKAEGTKRPRRERRKQHLGFFQRSFRLPSGVAGDKVDARFQNDTLTITIPRSRTLRQEGIDIREA